MGNNTNNTFLRVEIIFVLQAVDVCRDEGICYFRYVFSDQPAASLWSPKLCGD